MSSEKFDRIMITMDMLKQWEPCEEYRIEVDNKTVLNENHILELTGGRLEISVLDVFKLNISSIDKFWLISHEDIEGLEEIRNVMQGRIEDNTQKVKQMIDSKLYSQLDETINNMINPLIFTSNKVPKLFKEFATSLKFTSIHYIIVKDFGKLDGMTDERLADELENLYEACASNLLDVVYDIMCERSNNYNFSKKISYIFNK